MTDRLEIALDNPRSQFISATFAPKGVDLDMPERCKVQPGPRITASCSFPSDGVFRVSLFANAQQYGMFEHVATFEAVKR